jgi:hypothetical protein
MFKPWVLIWDLDETLVTGWKRGWRINDIVVNPKSAHILSTAVNLRSIGIVKYIFLLTNNSDRPYINAAIKRIGMHINDLHLPERQKMQMHRLSQMQMHRKPIFDCKLINDPRKRTYNFSNDAYNPDKSLRDVDYLLNCVKDGGDNTRYRILFFDDRGDHVMRKEIPADNYIQITPPFAHVERGQQDRTPWAKVMRALKGRKNSTRRNQLGHLNIRKTRRLKN